MYGGVVHLTIRLADGTLTLTPEWMLRPAAAGCEIRTAPRLSLARLRDLRAYLDAVLGSDQGDSPPTDGADHFTRGATPKRRIAPQALARFKERVRETTRRTRGASLEKIVEGLSRYLIGWRGYFGFCETSVLRALDQWIRRRLRSIVWRQWKRGRTRYAELRRRGVDRDLAAQTAGSAHGPWRISNSPALNVALPNALLRKTLGLASLYAGQTA